MGLSVSRVLALMRDGWLDNVKVGGRRYVHPDAAADRARLNERRKVEEGAWTVNGWKRRASKFDPVGMKTRGTPPPLADFTIPPRPDEIWISAERAGSYLGIGRVMFQRLARRRGMASETRRTLGDRAMPGQGMASWKRLYALSHIHALQDERDHYASWRNYSPKDWHQYKFWKPPHNNNLNDVPPTTWLITVKEASQILGCAPVTLRNLVRAGRFFAWQEKPGKPGCPIYLSGAQVCRRANDPYRLAAQESQKGTSKADPEKEEARRDWLSRHKIDSVTGVKSGNAVYRDHGDFYSTKQAARYLGVQPKAVKALMLNRRLQGYKRPMQKGQKGTRKWYYFKKEEVHALLDDPVYLAHRHRWRGRLTKAEEDSCGNPPEATEEELLAFDNFKRRLRAEHSDPELTNHATRGW